MAKPTQPKSTRTKAASAAKGGFVPRKRRMRGFETAGGLLREPIRKAGETRGFAVTGLLTHWDEVAGPDLAPMCRPVKVSYAQGGLGATLTVLASGAAAPLVQMQLERLRERVNGVYGYGAIARVRITQTAPEGFSDGPKKAPQSNIAPPSPEALARAQKVVSGMTEGVSDTGLRAALDRLAANVLTKDKARAKLRAN